MLQTFCNTEEVGQRMYIIVVVKSRFLERPQKRSGGDQLIHRLNRCACVYYAHTCMHVCMHCICIVHKDEDERGVYIVHCRRVPHCVL